MLSVYFLLGIFCLLILGFCIALFFTFRWWDIDDRGELAYKIAIAFFIAACISGAQVFEQLRSAEKNTTTVEKQ